MKTLSVVRKIEIPVYNDVRNYYVKTRDVAMVLGVKQPFEFTAGIKKLLGNEAILKGEKTEAFRLSEDSSRTTFVSCNSLFEYLNNPSAKVNKMIPSKKDDLLDELSNFLI